MTRPRLLIVSDSLSGGLGMAAIQQGRWFADHGWGVTIAAASLSKLPPDMKGVQIPLPHSVRQVRGMVAASRALRAASAGIDVLHCHGLRSFAASLLAGRRAFVTVHVGLGTVGSDPPLYPVVRRFGLWLAGHASLGAMSATPEYPPPWTFMPHASPHLGDACDDAGGFADSPTFVWVGRLVDQKRPDLFVRAIATVAERHQVRAYILGSGPLEEEVAVLTERTGAPVALLGWQADPTPWISRAWAVVLLSRFEALAFAAQEAMWLGRPVIASDLPGLRFLVGDTGCLVSDDVDDIARAIAHLCDHATAAELGRRASARVRSIVAPDAPWPRVHQLFTERL